MLINSFLLFLSFYKIIYCNTIDKLTGLELTSPWLETGFLYVDDKEYITITTKSTNFNSNSVVFISLPYLGGDLYTEGLPVTARLKNIISSSGKLTFSVKLFQPNDSYCSKEWYVPTYFTSPIQVGWMVANQGVYNLTGHQFVVSTGQLNRTHATLAGYGVTSDVFRFPFPTGCDSNNPSDICRFSLSVPLEGLGAIATIQSLVYETFLILRTSILRRQDITLILTPHDSASPSYYYFPEKETAAFMVYETGIYVSCFEGLAFETASFSNITSYKFQFTYQFEYLYTPGVFGHILSQNSLTDMTQLRVFDGTKTSSWIITQEDQCFDEQTKHTTKEKASAFVIGEIKGKETVCNIYYNSPIHYYTYRVDLVDLFGDGWINLYLIVLTDGITTNYTLDCASDYIVFNSTSGIVNFTMISTGSLQAPWEAVWFIKLNNIVYSGGYTTVLQIHDETILYSENLINVSTAAIEGCSECHGPDPVPAKRPGPPAGPGDGPGPNNGPGVGVGPNGPGNNDNKGPGLDNKEPNKKPPVKKGGNQLVTLYDLDGDGWYDEDEALILTTSRVPTTVTYPKYYILNEDKTELVTSGTSCDKNIEVCQEYLDDGEYIFRVAGINPDPDDKITWRFCNTEGTLGQELHFRIKRGICYPGQFISAADYCSGLNSVMTLNGVLNFEGVTSETLSSFNLKSIESRLGHVFTEFISLKATSYEYQSSSSSMLVSFEVEVATESYGYDGTVNNNVLIVFNNLVEGLESMLTDGTLVNLLRDSTKESSLGANDPLYSVSSVSLKSFELSSVEYILKSNGKVVVQDSSATYVGSNPYYANVPSNIVTSSNAFTVSGNVASICASLVGFVFIAFVATRGIKKYLSSKETHLPLPIDSVHIDPTIVEDDEEIVLQKFEVEKKKPKTTASYFRSAERV